MKLTNQIDQLLNATAQPVQLPDHKRISAAKVLPGLSETKALGPASTRPIFKNPLAASILKCLGLQFQVLLLS